MKLKSLLLTITATLGMYAVTMAQVPNYVPTDGLVGWWPFNGNANDESGNGNNGAVNGATLSQDRFGNENSTYSFDGVSSKITVSSFNLTLNNGYTFTAWVKPNSLNYDDNNIVSLDAIAFEGTNSSSFGLSAGLCNGNINRLYFRHRNSSSILEKIGCKIPENTWVHMVLTFNGSKITCYYNGIMYDNLSITDFQNPEKILRIGYGISRNNNGFYFKGLIDDIGIWNRALTEKEVINLYNASICSNDLFITAQNNTLQTGGNVTFTATTSDANASYIWQSDLGQGYQTLNNYGNYSGTNSENLNISNLQLSNHNQAIRAISTTEECTDTSNVVTIKLTDTCISLISVTDTLTINAQITNTNLPVKINTLKVFPNPASSQITIDYGNFNEMSGYTLTIVNSLGQSVFSTPINQQTSTIDISSLSGKGFYFIRVIDPQNNTIENRKLIIE